MRSISIPGLCSVESKLLPNRRLVSSEFGGYKGLVSCASEDEIASQLITTLKGHPKATPVMKSCFLVERLEHSSTKLMFSEVLVPSRLMRIAVVLDFSVIRHGQAPVFGLESRQLTSLKFF
jgi:hypothetical protein